MSSAIDRANERAAGLFSGHPFVVFDLEYTAWPGSMERGWSGEDEYREIVQIASLALSAPDFTPLAEFDALTRPTLNPSLSGYFTALTGIDDAALALRGRSFGDGLADWLAFVGDRTAYSWGEDGPVIEENVALQGLSVELPEFVNLRPIFADMGVQRPDTIQSGDLANALGSSRTFRSHDALADCRSIAEALRILASDRT